MKSDWCEHGRPYLALAVAAFGGLVVGVTAGFLWGVVSAQDVKVWKVELGW